MGKTGPMDDPKFDKAIERIFSMSEKMTAAAMTSVIDGDVSDMDADKRGVAMVKTLVAGLHMIAGAQLTVARLVSNEKRAEADQDHIIFVALLTALCLHPSGESLALEYGPGTIAEALNMFERATGRKIDGKLMPAMVRAARDVEAGGAETLKKFMEARAASKPA